MFVKVISLLYNYTNGGGFLSTKIYIILVCIVLIFLIWLFTARRRILKVYNKYLKIPTEKGLNGENVAAFAVGYLNLDIQFSLIKGKLTDAYSHKNKVLYMSKEVKETNSLASVAIVGHELGHAMQDKEHNFFFRLNYVLNVITHFTNRFIIPLLIFGLLFKILKWPTPTIGDGFVIASFVLFAMHAIFKLLTIPIEFGASRRALKFLLDSKLITKNESNKVQHLLNVAAQTYIVGLFDDFITTARKIQNSFR